MVTGRQSCSPGTVKASTRAITQPVAITTITGHGSSSTGGTEGGSEVIKDNVTDYGSFPEIS